MSVAMVVRLCDVMGTAVEYVESCCVVPGALDIAVEATVLVISCDAVVLDNGLGFDVLVLVMLVDDVEHDAVCSPTPTQYAYPSQKSLLIIIVKSAGDQGFQVISFCSWFVGHAHWFDSPLTRWGSIPGTHRR